jgi:hypothetical protein
VVQVGQDAKNVGEQLASGETVVVKDLKALSTNVVGDIGEGYVIGKLKGEGYTDVIQIQNASGHGVDIIARDPDTGKVKVMEVKTTRTGRAPRLSGGENGQIQGGVKYTKKRLDLAIAGNYGPAAKAQAKQAQQWIDDASKSNKISYEVQQVLLKQGDGGVVTAQLGINKLWGASP